MEQAKARMCAGGLVLGALLALGQASAEHAPDPRWEWRNPLPQGGAIGCVASGPEGWLAVAEGGALLRAEPDAAAWQLADDHELPAARHCTAMAQGADRWLVALQEGYQRGRLFHSADGRAWAPAAEGQFHGLLHHDGQFIAVGERPSESREPGVEPQGMIATSGDGAHWDAPVDVEAPLRDVTAGAGRYVAVGGAGAVFTSTDTVAWAPAESGTDHWLYAVAYGVDRFVAVGAAGTVLASADGEQWQAVDSGTEQTLYAVHYAEDRFVAVGSEGVVLESRDGLAWSGERLARGATLYALAGDGDALVAVGEAGEIYTHRAADPWRAGTHKASGADTPYRHLRRVAAGPRGLVAVGSAATVLHSADGSAWSARRVGTEADLWGVAYGDGAYVAVGSAGAVLRSVDGLTWALHRAGGELASVVHGAPGFVAVGGGGRIERSADGVQWEEVASDTRARLFDVAYGAQGYVAVGEDGVLLHAADGAAWERRSSGTWGPLTRVAWGNGRYLALAPDNGFTQVLHSEDGRLWNIVAEVGGELQELAYDGDAEQFVASGVARGGDIALHVSPDGAQWHTHSLLANQVRSLVAAGGALIGVGDYERILQAGAYEAGETGQPHEESETPPPDPAGLPDVNAPAAQAGCTAGAPQRTDAILLTLVLSAALYLLGGRPRVRLRR
ncbi:hypothetical protein HUS23_07745 [Ectothiorhodospiraceae bacterium 2226]|nr:hypothetical protein HUS23_07745 [Ectothiorhodospiraceae bacterium 2226]